jgi:hypothetical protein
MDIRFPAGEPKADIAEGSRAAGTTVIDNSRNTGEETDSPRCTRRSGPDQAECGQECDSPGHGTQRYKLSAQKRSGFTPWRKVYAPLTSAGISNSLAT